MIQFECAITILKEKKKITDNSIRNLELHAESIHKEQQLEVLTADTKELDNAIKVLQAAQKEK